MDTAFHRPVLAMRGISKRFPGVRALQRVDLELYRAEILALIGENGAGKSTLMNILGGVHQPDEGTIELNGQPVRIADVGGAMRLGIGFVHQECNVLDNLDVAGYMFLGREPLRGGPLRLIDRRILYAHARTYLELLGLGVPPNAAMSALSIAQRQMVEIAKALSQEACILIMDEPTSSLANVEAERLFQVVKDLRRRGVSIIYITHRLGEVELLGDRAVVLRDGRNAGTLVQGDIHHDAMVRLMVGRDLTVEPSSRSGHVEPGCFRVEALRTAAYPACPLTFQANRGEILGIAGLMGAGRSELARTIFGADARRGGRVILDGRELDIRQPRDAIGDGVCLVPEDRRGTGVVLQMTVRENITLPSLFRYATLAWVCRGRERGAAARQSEMLGIKAAALETVVETLSGGNQQKVVLAKWLAMSPRVLIFDEPTRGIDVGTKSEIYRLMRGLADAGVIVLMISSDMEELLAVSDRIITMHEGRITGTVDRKDFDAERIMHLVTGGRH
jgi:ribose transport system ATP-binding protein